MHKIGCCGDVALEPVESHLIFFFLISYSLFQPLATSSEAYLVKEATTLYMCMFGSGRHVSKTCSSRFCWFDAKLDKHSLPGNLKTERLKKSPRPQNHLKNSAALALVLPKCQQCFGHFKCKYMLVSHMVNGVCMCVRYKNVSVCLKQNFIFIIIHFQRINVSLANLCSLLMSLFGLVGFFYCASYG